MYKQLVAPNIGATDGVGWCLRQVQKVFHVAPQYPTAREAWNGQQGRHFGEAPPAGVAVPVWYSWHADYGSGYRDLGHVATSLADGRVLTSPFYEWQGGSATYPSMAALMTALREQGGAPKYLGWSEWLHDRKLVEQTHGNEENEMQFIGITGKAGERRGGVYAVFNGREAVFIGNTSEQAVVWVTSESAIRELQQRISGLR